MADPDLEVQADSLGSVPVTEAELSLLADLLPDVVKELLDATPADE